ncbi:MAG: Gfo/Idh/MocA family oxidoreductase [Victivallales bacterium]|nr:Gfo/Idh/MocA family oxidoreductase [Victivallales bacterium]
MCPKKILTVAQIGCGKFAWNQDLVNLNAHSGVRLKWVCDVNAESAARAAEHFGMPQFTTDLQEIPAVPEIEFIKIATTHEVHLPIIEAAAKAGKHIFCAKPMAMTDEEACRIIRAGHRSGIKLCADLNRRMSPAMQALRKKWLEHAATPRSSGHSTLWRMTTMACRTMQQKSLHHSMIHSRNWARDSPRSGPNTSPMSGKHQRKAPGELHATDAGQGTPRHAGRLRPRHPGGLAGARADRKCVVLVPRQHRVKFTDSCERCDNSCKGIARMYLWKLSRSGLNQIAWI